MEHAIAFDVLRDVVHGGTRAAVSGPHTIILVFQGAKVRLASDGTYSIHLPVTSEAA